MPPETRSIHYWCVGGPDGGEHDTVIVQTTIDFDPVGPDHRCRCGRALVKEHDFTGDAVEYFTREKEAARREVRRHHWNAFWLRLQLAWCRFQIWILRLFQ